ncbi:hypothetical protein FGIG_07239, partial [Fasciola gigantica]
CFSFLYYIYTCHGCCYRKHSGSLLSAAVETLSFTESVCYVIVNEDRISDRISGFRLQLNEIESAGGIQYSIDNDVAEKSLVRIDSNSGKFGFSTMPSPMSMTVTVRATMKVGSNHSETAVAVVRVHVVCFVRSHARGTIRNLVNIKFLNMANLDTYIKLFTFVSEGGPTQPEQLTRFNLSYVQVTGELIVCHPVPELATSEDEVYGFSYENITTVFITKTRSLLSGRKQLVCIPLAPTEQFWL